jgi:hypothetical protein
VAVSALGKRYAPVVFGWIIVRRPCGRDGHLGAVLICEYRGSYLPTVVAEGARGVVASVILKVVGLRHWSHIGSLVA